MNQMSLNVMATLVSSKKRKSGSGINYHRLSGDEDNNNRSLNNVTNNNNNKSVTVATATSTINKSRSQYSQHQSIDDPDDQHSINDFGNLLFFCSSAIYSSSSKSFFFPLKTEQFDVKMQTF